MKNVKMLVVLLITVLIGSLLYAQPAETEIEEDSITDSVRVKIVEEDIDIGGLTIDVDDEEEEDDDKWVNIGEDLTVAAEDTVPDDAVAILSDLTVHGHVVGDAVCVSGDLAVTGSVEGDVVSVGGSVSVESTAVIEGDLVCVGGSLDKMKGASVGGEVVNVPMPFIRPILHHALKYAGKGEKRTVIINKHPLGGFSRRIAHFFLYLVRMIALIVFIFLILLFFKGGVERVSDAIANHFWKAALAGFVGVILLVPITILLVVFVIGIPLVPLFWIAVIAGMIFGFACITYTIGKIAAEKKGWKQRSPYILALLGLLVVEIVAFLGNLVVLPGGPFIAIGAIIKVIGFIISYLAWMVGFGGVILTRFGAKTFGNGK